ncbi:WD repeat protein [Arthroderma uncinatum]|uniref:WD repeat protein n=1 Tax=Arthroderma uncinatum TaxID=74035 RepID=UPI00144AAE0E|nr:WD repeat protein [Arthroderma uncinatum]KAF3480893.1 WD repeat protein [Arthroderma uncinatum]
MAEPSIPFDGPRRAPTFPRQPEELHMPSGNASIPQNEPRQDQHNPNLPSLLSIQQQSGSQQQQQHQQFPNSNAGNNALPGALQPGPASRQGPSSTLNSSSGVPSQLAVPMTPSKQSSLNQLQSYPSSPGIDQQRYHQPSNMMSPPSAGQSTTPYSPLGLADIRPHMDLARVDDSASSSAMNNGDMQTPKNSNYLAPWGLYALDWCKWPAAPNTNSAGKIALGSYLEDTHNYIQILHAQTAERDYNDPDNDPGLEFVKTAEATHSYPVTRILWEPPSSQKQSTDLLATSGDHLRLWSLPSNPNQSQYYGNNSINRMSTSNRSPPPLQKLSPLALLSNSKTPEHTAPITSLDWNAVSPSLIITSSIDTTCTIWDIPTLTAKTQLIAHDKEVYDVRFCANSVDVFVSCGADGSVRMFDLRSLEHSTIIYEPSEKHEKGSPGDLSPGHSTVWPPPLQRIAASPHDAHLLATFAQDSNIIRVLDVRQPGQALLELKGHAASINCMEWSPSRRGTIATGADDSLVLIWDLINQNNAAALPIPPQQPQPLHAGGNSGGTSSGPSTLERGPAAAWRCDYEVSNISWAPHIPATGPGRDWLGSYCIPNHASIHRLA